MYHNKQHNKHICKTVSLMVLLVLCLAPTTCLADNFISSNLILEGGKNSLTPDIITQEEDSTSSDSQGVPLALRTNLLFDAVITPNIGVEYFVNQRTSILLNVWYAWWNNSKHSRSWRTYGADVEARWWLAPQTNGCHTGHHVGICAQALLYDFKLGKYGYLSGNTASTIWDRPTWGVGISYGYSWKIGKNLNMDCSLGLGHLSGIYQKYHSEDGYNIWNSSHKLRYWGVTKAEVSLVWYPSFFRTNNKKGGKR